jgi:hypothetical protein
VDLPRTPILGGRFGIREALKQVILGLIALP